MSHIRENIKVRLIDMNNFSVEEEVEFNVKSEIFEELNKYISFFEERGLKFEISEIKINNKNNFYQWILNRLYPMYKIEDHQKDGKGIPDFKLVKLSKDSWLDKIRNTKVDRRDLIQSEFEQEHIIDYEKLPIKIWIEVKRNGDGLHDTQFNWILDNRKKEIIKLLFIKEDNLNNY